MAEQIGWRGLLRQVSDEAPDWVRSLPQLPRLLHRALATRTDMTLATQLQLLATRQRRYDRLLTVLLGFIAALLAVQLYQLFS
jgi:ubiquinone biosynthesis protein